MIKISPFSVSFLFITITTWVLAYLSFKNSRGKKAVTLWGWTCITISLWGIGGLFATTMQDKNLSYLGWQFALVGTITIPTVYFHFVYTYCNLKCRKFLISLYIASAVLLIINFFFKEWFFGDITYRFNQFYYISWSKNSGYLYPIFYVLFYWLLLIASVSFLTRKFRKSSDQKIKNETKFVILSSFVGWIGGHADFLYVFQPQIYPSLNFLIAIFALITVYAILRYNFLDIKIIIKKGLIYTALVTIISFIYICCAVISSKIFLGAVLNYSIILTSLFSAMLIATIFTPLQEFTRNFIENLIFKSSKKNMYEEYELLRKSIADSEKSKIISTLASSIAHDIKSPLTAIKTYFEYFPQKKNDPKFLEDFQRIVGSEINRINDLTNNLLEFAKPSPLQLQPTDINALLEKSLTLLHHQLVQNNINVVKHLDSTDSIQSDPNKLTQAFLNLILNAIEAMPDGGTLTVSTKSNKDQIEIEIQDTGIGIPEKDLKNIFKPFFTQKEKGTGLGLAIVEEIIKNHNGTIKVKSTQSKGTTFSLVFRSTHHPS